MKSLIKPLNRLRVADTRRREPNWKENDEILNAAGVNDVNTLQQLSSKGVDITAAHNWNESTTLHIASQRGSCQVVALLLDVRAKPNAINNVKSTPLHYAASGGYQQVVKLLIDAKAPISYKDKDNKTPLHLAANRGHYEVVRMLVDAGAIVDARDKHGNTPLANAVGNNHHAIVKYLITEAKADISKISKDLQQRYKSHGQQQKSSDVRVSSSSIQPTPSSILPNQHQQRYVQQQKYIQQQMKQVHLMQRTQQYQQCKSQKQIERTSTHEQQCRSFQLQISKPSSSQHHSQERQQQSVKQQISTQLHQLFQLEVEIQIQPPHSNDQTVQEKVVQKQTQVKQQQNVRSTIPSTTSLHHQEEKSKCVEVQIQLQREQLPEKTGSVEEKIEQKQQKLIVEAEEEVVCTKEEVFYEEDHSRLFERQQEMNGSTSNSMSDVTDSCGNSMSEKSDHENDNDETCSENDALTIGINSTMNVITTQEVVQQVTNVDQSSVHVHKEHSSNAVGNSLTTLTGQPHSHSSQLLQQPHPPYNMQPTTNGITSDVHNSSIQKQQPVLPNLPHQQSYNYYPDYQSFYLQHSRCHTLPNQYLSAPYQPPPPPHHLYRHQTLPAVSQYHPPFAHYHQQGFQQHPYDMEHRSSSPAVLEQSSYHHSAAPQLQPVQEYLQHPYGMEHRSSSPAVLEQSSYHHSAAPQLQPVQEYLQRPYGMEHRSSSPAVLEQSSHPHSAVLHNTQLQPVHQQYPYCMDHQSSSSAVLEQPTYHHSALPQNNTTQYSIQPRDVSPQRLSPAMSSSPMFLRQPDVEQQQLPYSNNSPNGPQHIDLQVQELTRRIEELKSQREAYERTISQDENMHNEQVLHEMMAERRVVTPVIHIKDEGCQGFKKPSSETEESPTLSTTPPQLSSSSENSSNQSLHSIACNSIPMPTGNSGRTTPHNLPLQRSLESISTIASDIVTTVPHTVINSTTPDLPSDTSPMASNTEVVPIQNNKQQQNCANQIVSNLFSNFQSPPQGNVVVQMLFMQDNNIAFPPSATQSVESGEDNHNSLKPFTTDICSAIDVNTILPFMVKNGLLTSSQHQYFLNPYHTTNDKQNKLACIAVTINEDCVEKFLQCLEETSDYEPHETLLKKIRNGIKLAT